MLELLLQISPAPRKLASNFTARSHRRLNRRDTIGRIHRPDSHLFVLNIDHQLEFSDRSRTVIPMRNGRRNTIVHHWRLLFNDVGRKSHSCIVIRRSIFLRHPTHVRLIHGQERNRLPIRMLLDHMHRKSRGLRFAWLTCIVCLKFFFVLSPVNKMIIWPLYVKNKLLSTLKVSPLNKSHPLKYMTRYKIFYSNLIQRQSFGLSLCICWPLWLKFWKINVWWSVLKVVCARDILIFVIKITK